MKTLLFVVLALAIVSAEDPFHECVCKSGEDYDKATGDCKAAGTPTVENCLYALWNNGSYDLAKCSGCKDGFWLESETKCTALEDADKVENCEFQNNKNACYNCKDGYSPYDFNKKCGQLPSNCTYLDQSNTAIACQSCENKYKLNGTDCESVPENDVENCGYWSEKATCNGCNDGYYLESNKCVAQITVENCKQLYSSYKGCRRCEWGYSKSDDDTKCTKGVIVDCEVHSTSDDKVCNSCKKGFQLNAERTTCTEFATKPDNFDNNCQTYDKDSKCTHCTYSYKWEVDEDGDGRWNVYPKYGYTTAVKSCSKKCPNAGSDASILSFVLASLALLALLF